MLFFIFITCNDVSWLSYFIFGCVIKFRNFNFDGVLSKTSRQLTSDSTDTSFSVSASEQTDEDTKDCRMKPPTDKVLTKQSSERNSKD